ncbi:MAG: hypothetical protein ABH840_02445 [Nanoarchaeota archaeon]
MAKLKMEDIAFWILIALIIFVVLWKLVGSPTDTATLISVALFIIGSELLLWRALFSLDKKVACGFIKIKCDMVNLKKDTDYKIDSLNNKLDNRFDNIESLIRKR